MSILLENIDMLLVESRVSDAKEKFPEHKEKVDYFAEYLPGNNKYLMWAMREWVKDPGQSLYIVDAIKRFNDNVQRLTNKDINSYKSLVELRTMLNNLDKTSKEKKEELKIRMTENAHIIYNDKNYMVVRPLSEDASCYYGRGTQWCISYTKSENYWNQYTSKGKAFIFVFRK